MWAGMKKLWSLVSRTISRRSLESKPRIGRPSDFRFPMRLKRLVQVLHGFKVRHEDEVVDFSGSSSPLVNAADLSGEHEPDRRRAGSWNPVRQGLLQFGFEPVEAGFSGLQFFLELAEPAGVGEVTGADHRDSLLLGPNEEVLRDKTLGSGARKMRMDVKVCDESHRLDYRTSQKGCQCLGRSLALEEKREIEVESGLRRRSGRLLKDLIYGVALIPSLRRTDLYVHSSGFRAPCI